MSTQRRRLQKVQFGICTESDTSPRHLALTLEHACLFGFSCYSPHTQEDGAAGRQARARSPVAGDRLERSHQSHGIRRLRVPEGIWLLKREGDRTHAQGSSKRKSRCSQRAERTGRALRLRPSSTWPVGHNEKRWVIVLRAAKQIHLPGALEKTVKANRRISGDRDAGESGKKRRNQSTA